MSENSRRYIKAMYALDAVARRVPEGAWDNASCCDGWTAREVAGHAAWVVRNVGATTGAYAPPEARPEAEVAGADPAAAIADAVAATHAALDHQGALQIVAETPFGTMPVDSFIGVLWVDPLTHSWDIADAAGIPHGIDAAIATQAHEALSALGDSLRGPGRFGPEIETDSDAVSRFIGFTGRRSVNQSGR